MTVARSQLVDVEVSRYYHCISRCVRRAFLCGEGYEHRKQWIEDRLELLAGSFAVSVCGFSVMDNHLHVLVRLDPGLTDPWSDEEVVRRWIAVYPPRTLDQDEENLVQRWVDREASDEKKVAKYRARLQDLDRHSRRRSVVGHLRVHRPQPGGGGPRGRAGNQQTYLSPVGDCGRLGSDPVFGLQGVSGVVYSSPGTPPANRISRCDLSSDVARQRETEDLPRRT